MAIIQSLVLGIVQGLTEFLPVSSSGHLILVPCFLNWPDQGLAFDAVLHLGTGAAIIAVLYRDIINLFTIKRGSGKDLNSNLRSKIKQYKKIWLVIVGAIPAGVTGYFLNLWIEQKLRSVLIVATSLILWGIFLWLAELYSNRLKFKKNNLDDISYKQAILIGFTQIIAFIPGSSRSGMTIIGGLATKLDKYTAVKFSFLIGLPLVLGAGMFKIFAIANNGFNSIQLLQLILGFLAAFLSGIVALKLLLLLAKKYSFKLLAVYRVLLGLLILICY